MTQLGLARLLLARPDVLLLDEPTNNLDAAARDRLYDVLAGWSRTLLVVSHDRALLERMDRIGDLRDGAVRWYGGGWSAYVEQVAAEQEAARQAVRRRALRGAPATQDVLRAEQAGAAPPGTARSAPSRSPGIGKAERDYKRNRAERSGAKYRQTTPTASTTPATG